MKLTFTFTRYNIKMDAETKGTWESMYFEGPNAAWTRFLEELNNWNRQGRGYWTYWAD